MNDQIARNVEEDLHCPICGYLLRGLSQSTCPECGKGFDLEALRRAAGQKPNDAAFWAACGLGLFTSVTAFLAMWPLFLTTFNFPGLSLGCCLFGSMFAGMYAAIGIIPFNTFLFTVWCAHLWVPRDELPTRSLVALIALGLADFNWMICARYSPHWFDRMTAIQMDEKVWPLVMALHLLLLAVLGGMALRLRYRPSLRLNRVFHFAFGVWLFGIAFPVFRWD